MDFSSSNVAARLVKARQRTAGVVVGLPFLYKCLSAANSPDHRCSHQAMNSSHFQSLWLTVILELLSAAFVLLSDPCCPVEQRASREEDFGNISHPPAHHCLLESKVFLFSRQTDGPLLRRRMQILPPTAASVQRRQARGSAAGSAVSARGSLMLATDEQRACARQRVDSRFNFLEGNREPVFGFAFAESEKGIQAASSPSPSGKRSSSTSRRVSMSPDARCTESSCSLTPSCATCSRMASDTCCVSWCRRSRRLPRASRFSSTPGLLLFVYSCSRGVSRFS